jgi:hypothetical protein
MAADPLNVDSTEIEWRQSLVENGHGNASRLRDHPGKDACTTFSLFRYLPTEIRRRIWEMAIPQRNLRFSIWERSDGHSEDNFYGLCLPFATLPTPPVAHVCREARETVLRCGTMHPLVLPWRNSPGNYRTWFDPSVDIIELSIPNGWIPYGDQKKILRQAERILVHEDDIDDAWIGSLFSNPQCRQTLRTINIQWCESRVVVKARWDPQIVDEIFGKDSIAMVNLESSEEVERINEILSRARSLLPAIDGLPIFEPGNIETKTVPQWIRNVFVNEWLFRGGDERLKAHGLGSRGIRESLARMPRIRSVYTFELDNGVATPVTRPVMKGLSREVYTRSAHPDP